MSGRRADGHQRVMRSVQQGQVWAIPAADGYYALIVARLPAPSSLAPFVFVYISFEWFQSKPSPSSIPRLDSWDRAWVGHVALAALTKGRWECVGVLPRFSPRDWPVLPQQGPSFDEYDLCSVETTRDEGTLTVMENLRVSREEMGKFPTLGIVTSASSLERALSKWARNRSPNFHDFHIMPTQINRGSLHRWTNWLDEARPRCHSNLEPEIPPGRKTDREVRAGTWVTFPIAGGGFGAAIVVRRKAGAVIFGDAMLYGFPISFERYPTLRDVEHLRPEDACFVGGTSLICVRDGRWRVLGNSAHAQEHDWVVPYSFRQPTSMIGTGRALVQLAWAPAVEFDIPEPLLARAQSETNSNYSSGHIEALLGLATYFQSRSVLSGYHSSLLTTMDRLSAWRELNAMIDSQRSMR